MVDVSSSAAGGLHIELDTDEHAVMRKLVTEFRDLLNSGNDKDPVLSRFFPDPYEDEERNASWRALVGADLTAGKRSSVELCNAWLASGQMDLSDADAQIWLGFLTDLRLALATRLGATEEFLESDLDPSDSRAPSLHLFRWLGYLLELSIAELTVT